MLRGKGDGNGRIVIDCRVWEQIQNQICFTIFFERVIGPPPFFLPGAGRETRVFYMISRGKYITVNGLEGFRKIYSPAPRAIHRFPISTGNVEIFRKNIYTHTHTHAPMYINHFFPFPPQHFGHSLHAVSSTALKGLKRYIPSHPRCFSILVPEKRGDSIFL